MNLTFDQFYRRYGVRQPAHLQSPVSHALEQLTLPVNSLLHYRAEREGELGPDERNPLFAPIEHVYVGHVTALTGTLGSPRPAGIQSGPLLQDYRNQYRHLRPLNPLTLAGLQPKSLVVLNYALLDKLFRYTRSSLSLYQSWYNQQDTLWQTARQYTQLTTREQFIVLQLPRPLPSLAELHQAELHRTAAALRAFSQPEALDLLELWTWVGPHRNQSTYRHLPVEQLGRINLVFQHLGQWLVLNLGQLEQWRQADPTALPDPTHKHHGGVPAGTLQQRLLQMLTELYATVSPVEAELAAPLAEVSDEESVRQQLDELSQHLDESSLDDLNELDQAEAPEPVEVYDEDGNLVESAPSPTLVVPPAVGGTRVIPTSYEAAIQAKAEELGKSGLVTGAELRRLQRLSTAYQQVRDPYGQAGSLVEAATLTQDDLVLQSPDDIPDAPQILDPSLRQHSVEILERQYIERVLRKDILASVLAVQHAGIAVTGYEIERVTDAVSDYEIHAVTLTPAAGKTSTVKFRVPVIRPNGTYISNGVTYRLRKQRADLPIRKVSPDRVGLSSNYAKIFVERSERGVFNYQRWLLNTVIAKGTNPDDPDITDLKISSVEDPTAPVGLIYSLLASRIGGFKAGGVQYWFDYKRRHELGGFTAEERALERAGRVLVGRGPGGVVLIDRKNTFHLAKGTDLQPLGTVEQLLNLPAEKAPVQIAELKLFAKTLPVGVVLGYLLGLEGLCQQLRVTPRRVPNGERLNLAPDEYALRFLDESWVFSRQDGKATMLLAGFNLYKNTLRNYTAGSFNRKDIYLNLLDSQGIGVRYLRELDQMNALFIDPITKGILEWMHEPTLYPELLIRATELLETRQVPEEVEGTDGLIENMERARGYERVASAVYSELVKAIRVYNARTATGAASVSMNPHAVWTAIVQDPATSPIEELNPVHNLKEREVITFGGTGGRSRRSMVANTRLFKPSDLGFISEGTVDSGDVAIITYLSPNANFTTVRGTVRHYKETRDGTSSLLSTSALLAPAADRDDPKRVELAPLHCKVYRKLP